MEEVADEFRARWRFSPLAAYRYALGLTQTEVARRYNEITGDSAARMDASVLSKLEQWPAISGKRPTVHNLAVLAEAYGTQPCRLVAAADVGKLPAVDRLVLGLDAPPRPPRAVPVHGLSSIPLPRSVTPPPPVIEDSEPEQDAGRRRALLQRLLSSTGTTLAPPLLDAVEQARRAMDDTLCLGTVSVTKIDLIEEGVANHLRAYTHTPPLPMLGMIIADFLEVRHLSSVRQPASIQVRLSQVTSMLATLAADALMKCGQVADAHAWYGTARLAADDAGNPRLRAQVRAQAAMLPYYFGSLTDTIRLAREAQTISAASPCSATTLAAAAEARALARMGQHDRAEQALRRAQELFERTGSADTDEAFVFSEKRLLFYLSGTLTYLRQTRRADQVQHQALKLYRGTGGVLDPALVQLDRAVCLASDGEVADAAQLTTHTLATLPEQHRTSIVYTRVRDVIEAVPHRYERHRSVDELRGLLATSVAAR
ncbi:tetratricopeptide (TPR) repeat protein [Kutzneria viridogrisea]|nr:helix-turn-helix transcriptional regulator [Kutzneria albida]MBA8925466.1 tetratricopeptide (TPR) repeat protein [Kutzneria viridogrisea]